MLELLLRLADRQGKTLTQIGESIEPDELALRAAWLEKFAPEIKEKRQADWRTAQLIAAIHNAPLTKWVYKPETFMPQIEAGPPDPHVAKPATESISDDMAERVFMGLSRACNPGKQ